MVRLAQEALRPVNSVPYDLSMVSTRRSSKDGFISYGGNRYSVPAGYALSQLTVRETPEGRIEVYAALECVARHELAAGRHQSIVDPAHFEALWQALRDRQGPDQVVLAGPRLGPEVTEPQVEVRSLDLYEALAQGDV